MNSYQSYVAEMLKMIAVGVFQLVYDVADIRGKEAIKKNASECAVKAEELYDALKRRRI